MTAKSGHSGVVNVQLLKASVHSGVVSSTQEKSTSTMDSIRPKICKRNHVNSSTEIRELDREDGDKTITDANRDARNRHDVRTKRVNSDTATYQTLQHTGSVCVKIRSSRAVPVCLVLLCVLLLTAVIVLCVKLSQTIDEIHIKYKNLTEEKNELDNTKSILHQNITELLKENKVLITKKLKLKEEIRKLWQHQMDGWKCYQSSLYFISSEKTNWTESRRDCTERGADLIIINNREEQEFLKRALGAAEVWIGLTDSDVEGSWKWVDGSNMTFGFWRDGEPSDGTGDEDCAITVSSGFALHSCSKKFKWICENTF